MRGVVVLEIIKSPDLGQTSKVSKSFEVFFFGVSINPGYSQNCGFISLFALKIWKSICYSIQKIQLNVNEGDAKAATLIDKMFEQIEEISNAN